MKMLEAAAIIGYYLHELEQELGSLLDEIGAARGPLFIFDLQEAELTEEQKSHVMEVEQTLLIQCETIKDLEAVGFPIPKFKDEFLFITNWIMTLAAFVGNYVTEEELNEQ